MAKNFGETRPPQEERWDTKIVWAEFKKAGEYYQFRLVGLIFVYAQHWIEVKPGQPDTKKYPRECTNFDQESETNILKNGCPGCEKELRYGRHYLINAIDREAQKNGVSNPIVCVGPLPPGMIEKITGLAKLNGGVHMNDVENARDVFISYDGGKAGTDKWSVQIGPDRTPLGKWKNEKGVVAFPGETDYEQFNFEEIYKPNLKDADEVRAYNANTKASMVRQGYYGEVAKKEEEKAEPTGPSDPNPPQGGLKAPPAAQSTKSVTVETEKPAEPVQQIQSQATAAPAPVAVETPKIATTPTQQQAAPAASATAAGTCPHDGDAQGHKFGGFQGDPLCMKCPNRNGCIAASED